MKKKITLIILLISICIPLIIFNGKIDDFAPQHVAIIHETISLGHNSEIADKDIPEFYIFGAILTNITGLATRDLLFFPVQLIPFAIVFFFFIYKISNDYFLTSIITLIEMNSGISGTLRVFLWPHGLGFILFFIFTITIIHLINRNKRLEFGLLSIILGVTLTFISYDLHIISLIYMIGLILIMWRKNKIFARYIFFIFLIIIIAQFGLSNFFYDTIVTVYKGIGSVDISSTDKFLLSYFKHDVQGPIEDIYLTYPSIITQLGIIKYSILFICIVLFITTYTLKTKNEEMTYNRYIIQIFTISIIFAYTIYAILRMTIGAMIAVPIYYSGLISNIWLYTFSKRYRKWAIFVVIILLIMAPLYFYFNTKYNLINNDENKFYNYKFVSKWINDKESEVYNKKISSDELTKNLLYLYNSEKLLNETVSYEDIRSKIIVFYMKDILLLIKSYEPSGFYYYSNYLIINYELNAISIGNWKIIRSWNFSKNIIEDNKKINKIYDINSLAIYYRERR